MDANEKNGQKSLFYHESSHRCTERQSHESGLPANEEFNLEKLIAEVTSSEFILAIIPIVMPKLLQNLLKF